MKLGGHDRADFSAANCDLVVASPAVPFRHELLEHARRDGVPVTTELALAAAALPPGVRTAAVTGSNGKTTTCALLHAILTARHASAGGAAWLAGNGGGSLLDGVDGVRPGDAVVWEVSSFQLEYLNPAGFRCDAAVVTNFAANHLDRHGTVGNYRAAKAGLLANLRPTDAAVLNATDADVTAWPTPADRLPFTTRPCPLPGVYNAANAAAAEAAAVRLGCSSADVEEGIATAAAPPHRLELVCERRGVRFVNDSAATTPESLIAALHATPPPVFLIAGGANKGADFTAAACEIIERTAAAYFIGAVGPALRDAVARIDPAHASRYCGTLNAAFAAATAAPTRRHGAALAGVFEPGSVRGGSRIGGRRSQSWRGRRDRAEARDAFRVRRPRA